MNSLATNRSFFTWAFRVSFVVALPLVVGCTPASEHAEADPSGLPNKAEIVWVSDLVQAEELILDLTVDLSKMAASVNDLRLPNADASMLFADQVRVTPLTAAGSREVNRSDSLATDNRSDSLTTKATIYESGPAEDLPVDGLRLWEPLFQEIETFKHAKFSIVSGQFTNTDRSQFESKISFDGLAKLASGKWAAIQAKQTVTWDATPKNEKTLWRISAWLQTSLEVSARDSLLFQEVTADWLPPAELATLRESIHDQFVSRSFRNEPLGLPHPELEPYFSTDATMCHPSVAVVDINDDGWDDLYLTTRWRKNRLFVNQRDGTFVNMADQYGLAYDRTSCAIFVDLDNDGDKDAFLGRCFAPSVLLTNEDGRFVDRTSESLSKPLPGFIASASAADYDNDGLLDLYLCSYTSIGGHIGNIETAAKFMPFRHAKEMVTRFINTSPAGLWLDRPGPPNRLLRNLGGGKFKSSNKIPEVWANTFQSTWSDFDQDGDVDLYLSNDFAPDNLFRNDGELGFVDITQKAGGSAMSGYGMGVTWGDYDNDGWQDLYVSNMYSKAGKRIIGQMQTELDPRYLTSANGNRLFRNLDGRRFDLVSGEEPDDLHVTKAGWSWGGQFCDFDNDGWLDLYVASGFYTAPKEITCHTDL